MIDFRYHLVSLISVFLALAVGIVLGAGPLRENLGDQLAGQVEQLRTEQEQLRTEAEQLAGENDQLSSFITEVGPEVILGSSRMKSGTAQKMVLNMISTGVMIRLGRVYSNLMTDMPITNAKLARRAQLMVELAAGVDRFAASNALTAAGNDVKTAVVVAAKKVSADEARAMLHASRGNLREAIDR